MDIATLNTLFIQGNIDHRGLFPHLDQLKQSSCIFNIDFGLKELPLEPGILLIRGPRQYGKSTWLEQQIYHTLKTFGGGSAFYLNGDYITDQFLLEQELETLVLAFPDNVAIRRIFIDEVTAVPHWEFALKRLADQGKLKDVLVITTGSKATDLRRGAEKLPGRKGRLARTNYLFTPISYAEFSRVCGERFGPDTLTAYLLSGGSPICCVELADNGQIPEFVIQLTRDWIEGEIAASGRSRAALLNIMSVLFRWGGTPVGQAKLAREAGLSNNTIAANYIELLNDLTCVIPSYPWDANRNIPVLRKPCKYHFTNLLTAVAYYSERIYRVEDFLALPEQEKGKWYEWLVAQELLRRSAISGEEILAPFSFWQNQHHEIDFVCSADDFIEVKKGACSPLEFAWFSKSLPNKHLTLINPSEFKTRNVSAVSLENFLMMQSQDFNHA
jgi:predicted AAA+ superfamily ATPase